MLIKNIKTTQANLQTAHDTLSSNSNVGLIVCEDTNKIYVQGDDFTQPPLNISTTDNWKFTSTLRESSEEVVTLDTPLTFKAVGDGTNAIRFDYGGYRNSEAPFYYSKNNGDWVEYEFDYENYHGQIITLTSGDIIAFSGSADAEWYNEWADENGDGPPLGRFYMTGTIRAYGNIQSLMNFDQVCPSACYNDMFSGCTSLITPPLLPATILGNHCYAGMFRGCSSLIYAPALPAITLAEGCYSSMFQGCTSLSIAPDLPATTLADYCYTAMFANCSSLTDAPSLPATTLAFTCYSAMFSGCTNLSSIAVTFTSWNNGIGYWVYNVANEGTFYCPEQLDTTTRGVSHVPQGWTVSHEARVLSNNSSSNSDTANFLVNQKYIRDDSKSIFVLPTEEYAQVSGDTIEFYNANSGTFAIKQGETSLVEIEDGTSGQYFKFYWDGTNWNQITIGSSSETGGGTGTLSAVEINDTLYSNTEEDGIAHLGSGYVQIDGEPTVGEYLKYTEDGWTTQELAKLSCSYTSEDVSNNILSVSGDYLPIMIRTNKNTLYPIEKGTMTLQNGQFKIKLLPYLSYDNSAEFTGTWVVYFGSGINDVYTTANTVTSGAIADALPYSVDFEEADVHVLNVTATGTVTLLVTNLAVGHGMVIKVINNNGASIQFAGRTLIAESGTYSFSVFCFEEGKVEQIGEVTQVYAPQVLTP